MLIKQIKVDFFTEQTLGAPFGHRQVRRLTEPTELKMR